MIGVFFFMAVTVVFMNHALAYIDPGTGSMIIQGLLAAIAACAVTIGIFWGRLKNVFRKLFRQHKHE
jgi:uncharacterized membrane protein